jgi:hypothetical protein
LGFRSGGRERAVEQTAQGGVDGLMRHLVSGSAVEQPVPRKISDDDDTAAAVAVAVPPAGDAFGSDSIPGPVLGCSEGSLGSRAPRPLVAAGEELQPGQIYFMFRADLLRGHFTRGKVTALLKCACFGSTELPDCHGHCHVTIQGPKIC